MTDQTYLVECEHCHLLIRRPYQASFTVCDACRQKLVEWAQAQERLYRQTVRHHTAQEVAR